MNRNRFCWAAPVLALSVLTTLSHAQSASATPKSVHVAQSPSSSSLAWKTLQAGVSDNRASRQQAALVALSTIGPMDKTIRLVFSAVQDKDAGVRAAAVTALGEMHSSRAIPALKQSLEDDSGAVRFAAAKALWQLGDHSGRALLEQVLSKEQASSDGVFKQGLTDANKKLHSLGDLARIGLTEASGVFLGPFSYGVVVAEELAKDKSAPARAISASLLASDHDPKSIRALEDAVQDENAAVRTAAAKAIGNHPCKQLLPDLQFLLDDKDEVKYMAAASIVRIESRLSLGKPAAECEQLHQNLAEQASTSVR